MKLEENINKIKKDIENLIYQIELNIEQDKKLKMIYGTFTTYFAIKSGIEFYSGHIVLSSIYTFFNILNLYSTGKKINEIYKQEEQIASLKEFSKKKFRNTKTR